MNSMNSHQVRELLREVRYPGFTRDIVGAGFVGEIVTIGPMVEVEFKPNTRDDAKITDMEYGIRDVLRRAGFVDVQIRRVNPFVTDAPLRESKEAAGTANSGGSRLMTPLQAEFLEDGELPQADLLAIALGRVDVATAAGYGPGGPQPLSGPRESFSYESGISVLQWEIDPHDPRARTCQHDVKLGEWDYRVWWQVHPTGDLLYVSMQAMSEDWVDDDNASPHPVGRSAAVNLVYDESRNAVVAIYGTVRDFRPFVKAFDVAHSREDANQNASTNDQGAEK